MARSRGRELSRELGFSLADQTRLATAISEFARNVIHYAGRGICRIIDESNHADARIRVMVEDMSSVSGSRSHLHPIRRLHNQGANNVGSLPPQPIFSMT